jgi:indole-3-acetate monooxygenase
MRVPAAPADAASLLQAARELAPKIDGARPHIERDRQIPGELVDAMAADGLFSLWLPKARGGPELDLVDYVRVIEELARADGSVAWCATVASCLSRIAGYLQPNVAREIWGGGLAVLAGTINPTGKAFAVDGGYRNWTLGLWQRHPSQHVDARQLHRARSRRTATWAERRAGDASSHLPDERGGDP